MNKIEKILDRAKLNDRDYDLGTCGLCGTFALALHDIATEEGLKVDLVFACESFASGSPYDNKNRLMWRHALIRFEDQLYDVEGIQSNHDHIKSNYCWGSLADGAGTFVTVNRSKFVLEIKTTKSSYSQRHFNEWKSRLK